MGVVRPPGRAKLFFGLLLGDASLAETVKSRLAMRFGPTDIVSPMWPFTATDYYTDELGGDILRQFLFFDQLITVDRLAEIKLATNDLEQDLSRTTGRPPDRRSVNVDPGYVTLTQIVLATTKDQIHRLYLQDGIYGEVTMTFERGAWRSWPWTYPDFTSGTYDDVFCEARTRFKAQIREAR